MDGGDVKKKQINNFSSTKVFVYTLFDLLHMRFINFNPCPY